VVCNELAQGEDKSKVESEDISKVDRCARSKLLSDEQEQRIEIDIHDKRNTNTNARAIQKRNQPIVSVFSFTPR